MSQQKVLQTLVELGLEKLAAEIYVFVAKKGPVKARNITFSLKISKQRLYPILKNLQAKGIISATLEHPARFSALPFEKVLDIFIRAKMEEAQRVQQNKAKILSDWKSVTISEKDSLPPQFTVIEGRKYVYSKIQQMVQETKQHFSFVTTVPTLARADTFGLFDAAFNHPLKSTVRFRFITELNENNAKVVKCLLQKKPKSEFNLEGKTPNLELNLCPRMVIKDNEETLFFIDSDSSLSQSDDVCLWTNCSSLVQAFLTMFEELWRNSTSIEKKIVEIETGKQTPKTYVIADSEQAYKKYQQVIHNAENEVIMLTSSKALVEYCTHTNLVKKLNERGVSLKIMAPITSGNLEVVQQQSKYCEIRHAPRGYLETTIVDGKCLFQFKNPSIELQELKTKPHFEDTFYSDDPKYVNKTKTMLDDLWKNTNVPSAVTLASILRPSTPNVSYSSENPDKRSYVLSRNTIYKTKEEKLWPTNEKHVLSKFINAQKLPVTSYSKDIVRAYCSIGNAVIHPPDYFNLPEMLVQLFHIDKQSSFGAEDGLSICLPDNLSRKKTYVPVVMVHDNPNTSSPLKAWKEGTPAENNVQLVKKDELKVQVYGNTLFAGWTIPIHLVDSYTLPPSCIIIEGYGNIKTGSFTSVSLSGYQFKIEANGFDAFVTFIHPSSKYTGPGTDGYLCRDALMTIYPP